MAPLFFDHLSLSFSFFPFPSSHQQMDEDDDFDTNDPEEQHALDHGHEEYGDYEADEEEEEDEEGVCGDHHPQEMMPEPIPPGWIVNGVPTAMCKHNKDFETFRQQLQLFRPKLPAAYWHICAWKSAVVPVSKRT